jgi:hypothetical protein
MAGEGLLSIAAAFLGARAGSVVGALWDLDDAASLELMADFYDRAASGRGVAEALTLAKRRRLARGAPPRDWSGVVVWGAPDLMLPRPSRWRRASSRVAITGVCIVALVLWLIRSRKLRDLPPGKN